MAPPCLTLPPRSSPPIDPPRLGGSPPRKPDIHAWIRPPTTSLSRSSEVAPIDVLRDLFVRDKYRDVILPMCTAPSRRSVRHEEDSRRPEQRCTGPGPQRHC